MTEHVDGPSADDLGHGDPRAQPVLAGEGERGPVNCSEALTKLFEFLDAEIDEIDGDRIRQHLADCEPCLGEYDFEDHLKKVVRRSCHETAPVELHARIRYQLTILQSSTMLRTGSVLSPPAVPPSGDSR